FRRLAQKGVLNDEISGSRLEHSAGKVIEVPLPEQLQAIPLVIANSSRFVLKLVCPNTRDVNFNSTLSTLIDIGPTFPDGKLMIDPMQKENGGELGVSFNFAPASRRGSLLRRQPPDEANPAGFREEESDAHQVRQVIETG